MSDAAQVTPQAVEPVTPVVEKPAAVEPAPIKKEEPVVVAPLELKLPEGSLLDASEVEKIAEIAKKQGLSQDVAQGILNAKSEALTDFKTKQETEYEKIRTVDWVNEIKNDKVFGGEKFIETSEFAKRGIEAFGTQKLRDDLETSGFGNHPELIKTFALIGRSIAEDRLVLPGAQEPKVKKSAAELFYPNMK